MATPQYQQKPAKVYALQFDGSNGQAMVDWAPTYLQIDRGVLKQKRNPIAIAVGEWVVQWSNTEKRGAYERWEEAAFAQTWQMI